jgi:hypothetical protein
VALGFNVERWTSVLISHVIISRFGVRYHTRHIPRLMRKLGVALSRPSGPAVSSCLGVSLRSRV